MACDLQLKRKHVILVMRTGFGKTLPMWMPLIFQREGISILISPLQALGDQHDTAEELKSLGVKSKHLISESMNPDTFKVFTVYFIHIKIRLILPLSGSRKSREVTIPSS